MSEILKGVDVSSENLALEIIKNLIKYKLKELRTIINSKENGFNDLIDNDFEDLINLIRNTNLYIKFKRN